MFSRFTILLIFATVYCVVCVREPKSDRIDGNDSPIEQRLVAYYLRVADEKFVPEVDEETAKKYAQMAKCYNGAFTELKNGCNSIEGCDITQSALYKLCNENRELILDSYLGNMGKLTGSSVLVPLDYYNLFTTVIKGRYPEGTPLEKSLGEYPGEWIYGGMLIRYNEYCEQMINLVDKEFAQWGYSKQNVFDFFEMKTKLPFGQALELCRLRLEVSD